MVGEASQVILGYFPERWVRLGKVWVNSLSVTAILEQNDGTSEVRLAGGESYPSPYSAEDTILLFREKEV